jgi:magnesium-transporting ATPase (P-type)
VPLDGVIVEGEALMSLEHLTGEAAPVRKQVLDDVPGGSISTDGLLTIQVGVRMAERQANCKEMTRSVPTVTWWRNVSRLSIAKVNSPVGSTAQNAFKLKSQAASVRKR